jgi:recombinational DNA repair protein (RecF pathway)
MASQCEMIIGFLVPRRCENPALGNCSRCGRGYCEEHISVETQGLICKACSQGLEQPVALPLTAQSFSDEDMALFDQASRFDNDDDLFSDLS